MANFALDPLPHVPRGFEIVPRDPDAPPSRLYAYIGGVMDAYNEDLSIPFLLPAVAKEDFQHLAEALKSFFIQNMGVRLSEVQPSPIGDAFVRFNREVWIMLMLYPHDAHNNTALAKACAGFGLLRYWYDSKNLARVVCKVHLHDDARIPDDVVVAAGLEPRVRTWTCPIVVLKRKGVTMLQDEDIFPPVDGDIAHPFPPPPPRWMGMDDLNADAPAISESANGPSGDINMPDPPAANDTTDSILVEAPVTQSVDVAPVPVDAGNEGALIIRDIAVVPVEDVGASLIIPPGFENQIEIPKPPSSSARMRRRKMMKEPLDVAFLRRSSRLNQDQGFLNNAHAEAAVGNPGVYTAQVEGSSVTAPYLDVGTMQGIAGFLQIQPEAVSAAALLELDAEADE
ncbi:hypothetical protein HU200_011935 [Digitaria exilis]|uniref:Uncharacterized protein n=1 Tax=Digitaria exilis TaxID=1010633 RepID=A0A835FFK7_9POAL|nr:hypothetical protein HU200_011935 [Digitaria exilis]